MISILCPKIEQVRDYIRDTVASGEESILARVKELKENAEGRELNTVPMQIDDEEPAGIQGQDSDNNLVSERGKLDDPNTH